MTDLPGEHRRPDDDLVAAVLDGEATPEERARVESDPVLSARLAEFAAVRDLVAAPVPAPDDDTRERAIAAAKVAIRHQQRVVSLAERRRREVPRFLGAAAAVLVLLLGFGFLVSKADLGRDDSSESGGGSAAVETQSDEESSEDAGGGGALVGEGDSSGAGQDAPETADAGAAAPANLGAVADEAQLYAALRSTSDLVVRDADVDRLEQEARVTTTSSLPDDVDEFDGASERCQVALDEADPGLSGLLVEATAEYAGTPAVVYVYGTVTGRQRVIVVAQEPCQVLTAFDL